MEVPNNKAESQSREQPRKFQYFTGHSNTNNMTASSIDQHRNSIEQRIANLESKLVKKFNPQLELSTLPQLQSDNYVNTRRMYQYLGVNTDNKNMIPSNSQSSTQNEHNQQSTSFGFSKTRQITEKVGNAFNYLGKFDKSMDEIALRQKSKFSWESNKNSHQQQQNTMQPKDKLKAVLDKSGDRSVLYTGQNIVKNNQTKERLVGKRIKNTVDAKGQNAIQQQHQRKYKSSQKFTHKYPLSHHQPQTYQFNPQRSTIQHINPINGRYFQELNQLNTNISNLKHSVGGLYPFEYSNNLTGLQPRTISYDTGVNLREEPGKNSELYEMMKSIMVGQERLEKELMMLKNSKIQDDRPSTQKNIRNAQHIKPYSQAEKDKFSSLKWTKNNYIPDSRLTSSPIQLRQEQKSSQKQQKSSQKPHLNLSRSPQKTLNNKRRSVSPQTQKSKSPGQNNSQNSTSVINRKRANSAVISKKLPGKIQKNKERFDELYKQAQLNKRLNEASCRITVSKEAVSSVWEKIKQSIKRAESDDTETSVIYHENNRWVNDQLVSKIELQKKLKNDLVKKIYEMVENKCLFK